MKSDLSITTRRTAMAGRFLLTAVNLFQVIGTHGADRNETHIYNRNRPPHAKFHNAQTMAMAAVLAVASHYFVWRKGGDTSTNVLAATILGAAYWVTQGLADFYPGVGWTDSEFLKADQTLNGISPQMVSTQSFWGSFSSAGISRESRPDSKCATRRVWAVRPSHFTMDNILQIES